MSAFFDRTLLEGRLAVRFLARTPRLSVPVIATLAIAVAANSTVFGFVNGVLLRSLPFPGVEALATVRISDPAGGRHRPRTPLFAALLTQPVHWTHVAAYDERTISLTNGSQPARLRLAEVSGGFFATLGVQPKVGRGLTVEDERPGTRTVVITDRLSQRMFGGKALGEVVDLDGERFTIVGVMPAFFGFPSPSTDLWIPMGLVGGGVARVDTIGPAQRTGLSPVSILLRVKTSYFEAGRELTARFERFRFEGQLRASLVPVSETLVGDVRPLLWVLQATALVLLTIAAANTAGMVLGSTLDRRHDMTVRLALGASRAQLIWRHTLEVGILVLSAGALGILFTAWGIQAMRPLLPTDLAHHASEIRPDQSVLAVTAVGVLCAALAAVAVPMLELLRLQAGTPWVRAARATFQRTSRDRPGLSWRVLCVGQTAGAMLLVSAAVYLTGSFRVLSTLDAGFDTTDILVARVEVPTFGYLEIPKRLSLQNEILSHVRTAPLGLAGSASNVPFDGTIGPVVSVSASETSRETILVQSRIVAGDYFRVLRVPLHGGRYFDERDHSRSQPAVIVSEAFARQRFGSREALGRSLTIDDVIYEVIGIVADVKSDGLVDFDGPTIYRWAEQLATTESIHKPASWVLPGFTIVARTPAGSRAAAQMREAIRQVDDTLTLPEVETMESRLGTWNSRPRFAVWIMGLAAVAALVLCGVGVFGMAEYSVARRTHELAVRVALGARPDQIRRLILRSGALVLTLGLLAGVLAWWWGVQALRMIMPVSVAATPPAMVGACVVILTSLAAWSGPSRRALSIAPGTCLRSE